jgi:hypothetical protein
MNPIEERSIQCPHCGEVFDILIDCMSQDQMYIEDCTVCCSPIELIVTIVEFDNRSEMRVQVAATQ